jgi:hypothetical protein
MTAGMVFSINVVMTSGIEMRMPPDKRTIIKLERILRKLRSA